MEPLGRKQAITRHFWDEAHRFFIPAFTSSLEDLLALGLKLLLYQKDIQPGTAAQFEPVSLSIDDVSARVEFMVMVVEAERKDKN